MGRILCIAAMAANWKMLCFSVILIAIQYSAHSIGSSIHADYLHLDRQSGVSETARLKSFSTILRLRGGRKGVSAKHTSTEIARKTVYSSLCLTLQ